MHIPQETFVSTSGEVLYTFRDALLYLSKHIDAKVYWDMGYAFMRDSNLWKQQPEFSPDYYFDLHSQYLKDTYDNIVLMYSGGTDSHTILESLLRVRAKNVTIVSNRHETTAASPYRTIIQNTLSRSLKAYTGIFKELNYKVIGVDDGILGKVSNATTWERTLSDFSGNYNSEVALSASWLRYANANQMYKLSNKGTSCVIWGVEKPQLVIDKGWWCWQATHGSWVTGDIKENDAIDKIYFFATDAVPELQISLAYKKAEILEQLMKNKQDYKQLQSFHSAYYQTINRYMNYAAINSLLDSNKHKIGGLFSKNSFATIEKAEAATFISNIKDEYFKHYSAGIEHFFTNKHLNIQIKNSSYLYETC